MWELCKAKGAKCSFALKSSRGDQEEVAIRDASNRLKKLAVSGGLAWQGQKLICDLLSPFFLELSALLEGEEVIVEATLARGSSRFSLEKCSAIFPAPTPIVLSFPFVFFVDVDLRLLQRFVSGSLFLSHEEWEELKRECDEDVKIVEEGACEKALLLPKLILQDETGAFATCATEDWFEDLKDVGYSKSERGFYCSSDCVKLAIEKLLEKGWEVADKQGRKVSQQKSVSYKKKEGGFEGSVEFGEESVAFSSLQLQPHSPFVVLSDNTVGLIDREALPAEFLGRNRLLSKVEAASLGELPEFKGVNCGQVLPGKDFTGSLFPYQQKGVDWLHLLFANSLCGILADEMGLGKSVQLLAFFSGLNLSQPLLIVAPTSLLQNWQREAERFWPDSSPCLYYGQERDLQKIEEEKLVLTSYAILRRDSQLLSRVEWGAVALDEAQMIKNPKSQTFQAALKLKTSFRLSITGTPIENHLSDLWAQFQFLLPNLLGSNPKVFNLERTKPFILRRTKDEVELDLPEKLEQIVYVSMNEKQQSVYDAMVERTREEENLTQMEVLERLLRLRQICCDPRLINRENEKSAKLERLMSDLEELEGKKVLVYSQFTQMLGLIGKELEAQGRDFLYLDGKSQDRMELVDRFQNDPNSNIFLISLKAGGVGLNLTAADYVLIYDPWWNEAVENQAIDRAHRIGRKGTVIARRYVTVASLEEKIMQLKDRKRALVSHSLSTDAIDFQDLAELLS